jgi:hypothetical protein
MEEADVCSEAENVIGTFTDKQTALEMDTKSSSVAQQMC